MPPQLASRRLQLRPLRLADAGPIQLWCGQYRVASMLARVPHPYPPGAAAAFIERSLRGADGERVFAIDCSPSGAADFLGVISVKQGVEAPGFGYWLGPPAWGMGFATEAAATLLEAVFADGVDAVLTTVYQDNAASRRVLDKLGFCQTGTGEKHCPARGIVVPECILRLDRADWRGAAAVLEDAAESTE